MSQPVALNTLKEGQSFRWANPEPGEEGMVYWVVQAGDPADLQRGVVVTCDEAWLAGLQRHATQNVKPLELVIIEE